VPRFARAREGPGSRRQPDRDHHTIDDRYRQRHSRFVADTRIATLSRLRRMGMAMTAFAVGAAAAAFFFSRLGTWCFVVPPIVALAARIGANSIHAVPPEQPVAPASRPAS